MCRTDVVVNVCHNASPLKTVALCTTISKLDMRDRPHSVAVVMCHKFVPDDEYEPIGGFYQDEEGTV